MLSNRFLLDMCCGRLLCKRSLVQWIASDSRQKLETNRFLVGTKWFPGENVGIGKDHTIYAKVAGYVRYYRNPAIHPKRRYIGVALEREGQGSQLPTPPNAITRRRLGMHAAPMKPVSAPTSASQSSTTPVANERVMTGLQPAKGENIFVDRSSISLSTPPPLARRSDGLGIAGFEIGRAAERKGIHVKEFDRSDRWLAWRIRGKKMKEKLAQRQAKKTKKTKGKKSNKMVA